MIAQTKEQMDKHLKARDTLYKLGQHPAIPSPVFSALQLLHIDIVQVCKHGEIDPFKGCVSIWYTSDNYKKYTKEFDEEFKEYTEEELKKEKRFISIDVPYEKVYGEKWVEDHVEYWGDLSFCFFIGKNFDDYIHTKSWTTCAGVTASGLTFEDMVVAIGKKFFKTYGDFDSDDFLTAKEKANHVKENIFISKHNKAKKYYTLEPNPKYMCVDISELNRRWAKWLYKTEKGKELWGETLKQVLSGSIIH